MTMGNRNNQNCPFAIGFQETENTDGYIRLMGMTQKNERLKDLVNSDRVAIIRDRARCFDRAIMNVLPKCKNRVDCIHLGRSVQLHCPGENMKTFFDACFANTEQEYNQAWGMVSDRAKKYLIEDGNLLLLHFIIITSSSPAFHYHYTFFLTLVPSSLISRYCYTPFNKGGLETKQFMNWPAKEDGMVVNGENTSNRAEQEMIRLKKRKVRHVMVLSALIAFVHEARRLRAEAKTLAARLIAANQALLPHAQAHLEHERYLALKNRYVISSSRILCILFMILECVPMTHP